MEEKNFSDFLTAVNAVLPKFLGPKMDEYINNPKLLKAILEKALNSDMYFKDQLDYSHSFDEVLSAGNYIHIEAGINATNYDIKRKSEVKVVVFRAVKIPKAMGTSDVLKYLKNACVRLATNYELIYFGSLHPELQEKMMIHSLVRSDKFKNEMRDCLCLSYYTKTQKRILVRSAFENYYHAGSVFLGIYDPNINLKK